MSSSNTSPESVQNLFFVFTHNDEATIAEFLASVDAAIKRSESDLGDSVLFVLANGCVDETVSNANSAIAGFTSQTITYVEEIERGGKANAWNHAVHELAPRYPNAQFSVLMDSDIDLSSTDFGDLIGLLKQDGHALATTSHPRKRAIPFTPRQVVPFLVSRSSQGHENGTICGQLYAIRTQFAARIWMPRGLLVEDGFLAACLRTKLFSQTPDDSLIVAHPRVHHFFEVELTAMDTIKHEERTELGSHINFVGFPLLWDATPNAETMLHERYQQDPDWLLREFEQVVADRGYKAFYWNRSLDSFRSLRLSPALPVRSLIASFRSVQRTIALVRAYRRSTQGDLRW